MPWGEHLRPGLRDLPETECRELLATARTGRLAHVDVRGMQVCPVSIRVLGDALQVRALRGEHLDWAVTEQLTVSLEVDSPHEHGVPVRWSVHLRGSLRRPGRGRRVSRSAGDGPLLFLPRTIHGWAAVDGAAADGR